MKEIPLKGWNYIVYTLIKNHFKLKPFALKDLYAFEPYFALVYPANYHVKDKLRQTLQNLRNKGLLVFQARGQYRLALYMEVEPSVKEPTQEVVYLLSNEAMPNWVKIGRTGSIERRLNDLYNTSVPLPFKVESLLVTDSKEASMTLEKSIHQIIDTLNPALRKHTEASRREFFTLTVQEGKQVFALVSKIINIPSMSNQLSY